MTLLLEATLRASVIIGAGLLVSRLLHRRSAALRHFVVAATLVAGAMVPVLHVALPTWPLAAPGAPSWIAAPSPATVAATSEPAAATTAASIASTPSDRADALAITAMTVWLFGALVLAVRQGAALARLRALERRATLFGAGPWTALAREIALHERIRRPAILLETDVPDLLATWGVRRPRILVPSHARTWTTERVRAVLHHEIAHIRRMDWLLQLCAEGIRAVYWFNPLVWLASRELQRLSEQACDDVVLGAGVAPGDYAAHLLEIARSSRVHAFPVAAAMPMARPSTLESRVSAMLNPRLARSAPSVGVTALIVLGLVAVTIPVAALRLAQAGPTPLSGVVYDPTGAVLPSVELSLEDDRQYQWTATTDASGRFEFAPVQPGKYTIKASLPGFKPLAESLTLQSPVDWTRAVTLQVGDVRETITVRESRPKTDRRTSSAGPLPVRVGGNIKPPTKLHHVSPVYPPSMREAGIEGTVPLEARIDRTGNVASLRALSAQVHPDLARAAMDAVQQWRFSPTLLNGQPVEIVMTVSIEFELAD
jgi:TonB family protein